MITYSQSNHSKKGDISIEKIIYGDILTVINFSMDFLALYITGKIMHLKLNYKKVTLSAIFGAVYSLVIVACNLAELPSAVFSILVSILLTKIAYGKQKLSVFIKNTLVFYIVNFALGGGITAICNLLNVWQNKRGIIINGTFDTLYGDLPFGLLIIVALVCAFLSLLSGRIIKHNSAKKECTLEISINNNKTSTKALIDSGNLLKEPISCKPVIIIGFEHIRSILPMEIFDIFKTKNLNINSPLLQKSKIRFIPTTSIGGQGLLMALSPDYINLDNKEIDAYIAIDTQNQNYGGYCAIVPEILLQ